MSASEIIMAIGEPGHLSLAGEVVLGAYLMLIHREVRQLRRYIADCPTCAKRKPKRDSLPAELAQLALPLALGTIFGFALAYRPV